MKVFSLLTEKSKNFVSVRNGTNSESIIQLIENFGAFVLTFCLLDCEEKDEENLEENILSSTNVIILREPSCKSNETKKEIRNVDCLIPTKTNNLEYQMNV